MAREQLEASVDELADELDDAVADRLRAADLAQIAAVDALIAARDARAAAMAAGEWLRTGRHKGRPSGGYLAVPGRLRTEEHQGAHGIKTVVQDPTQVWAGLREEVTPAARTVVTSAERWERDPFSPQGLGPRHAPHRDDRGGRRRRGMSADRG